MARCFYPAILECFNSEEGQRAFAAWQADQAGLTNKENRTLPPGNVLLYIATVNDFFQTRRTLRGAPFFLSSEGKLLPFAPSSLLVRPRAGNSPLVQLPEENEKSEPFSYWKKVRILCLWCTSRDSNPGPTD